MKRLMLLFLAVLVLAGTSQAQDRKYALYGVAFYNLENLFDTIPNNPRGRDLEYTPTGEKQWTGERYWKKISNLAYVISRMATDRLPMGPAIIGVSEIENRSVLEDLVSEINSSSEAGQANAPTARDGGYKIVHHDSPDLRGVDVGLLYNPRLFKFRNVTNHTLKVERNPNFRTRDQMCVTGLLGGEPVAVIVNHWPSRLGGQEQSSYLREAAAALSKHIADSVWSVNPATAVIIMGDLNDDPMDKSCAKVLGASPKPEGVGPHGFYNPWWRKLEKEGIGTLAYKGSWNLFDQIIISGNMLGGDAASGLEYAGCRVLNFDFLRGDEGNRQGYPLRTYAAGVWLNGYSDHYPTMILLKREIKEGKR